MARRSMGAFLSSGLGCGFLLDFIGFDILRVVEEELLLCLGVEWGLVGALATKGLAVLVLASGEALLGVIVGSGLSLAPRMAPKGASP